MLGLGALLVIWSLKFQAIVSVPQSGNADDDRPPLGTLLPFPSLHPRSSKSNAETDHPAQSSSGTGLSVAPTEGTGEKATGQRELATQAARTSGGAGASCFKGLDDIPLSGLEQELERIWSVSMEVMSEFPNTKFWPTDGTLLGLMRNGRVATDRDIDLQIHATFDTCYAVLASLEKAFAKHVKLQSFRIAKIKHNGKKIGRYAMVRFYRKFGTFHTGVDFNCVYDDAPEGPSYFTHRSTLTPLPTATFPLGKCMFYGREVPCPASGMRVLEQLAPRYSGCMVFPHCMGDPSVSTKRCLSPHPKIPFARFVEVTRELDKCGYVSLAKHFETEPTCQGMLAQLEKPDGTRCETNAGGKTICFLQRYDG